MAADQVVSAKVTLRELCRSGDRTAATLPFKAPGQTRPLDLCNAGVNPADLLFVEDYLTAPNPGDDYLFVTCYGPPTSVHYYNLTTSTDLGVFAVGDPGDAFFGLALGPERDLFVSDYAHDRVRRFEFETGNDLGDFVSSGAGGLDGPWGLVFQGIETKDLVFYMTPPGTSTHAGGLEIDFEKYPVSWDEQNTSYDWQIPNATFTDNVGSGQTEVLLLEGDTGLGVDRFAFVVLTFHHLENLAPFSGTHRWTDLTGDYQTYLEYVYGCACQAYFQLPPPLRGDRDSANGDGVVRVENCGESFLIQTVVGESEMEFAIRFLDEVKAQFPTTAVARLDDNDPTRVLTQGLCFGDPALEYRVEVLQQDSSCGGECIIVEKFWFGNAIPTVSEWGLVVMTLLVLTAGTLVFVRKRQAA